MIGNLSRMLSIRQADHTCESMCPSGMNLSWKALHSTSAVPASSLLQSHNGAVIEQKSALPATGRCT